jgi:hypothetical protein
VRDNHSLSRAKGTVRLRHCQVPPFAQAKLVRVVKGAVLDAQSGDALHIPGGFAHGCRTLEPDTEVAYKVREYHAPTRGRNFLRTVQRLAVAGAPLRMVADQHGNPTPAAALASAIASIAHRIAAGRGVWGAFHCAGGPATTWHGFAQAIVAAGLPEAMRPVALPIATAEHPTQAARLPHAVLDCARLAAAYGIAQPDWRDFLPGPTSYASSESISAA